MTSLEVFSISLDILSNPVALLFAKFETPSRYSVRVNGAPSSDSKLSQFLSI